MARLFSIIVILFMAATAVAQGRKLPNITFIEHSTSFANANRSYDENDQLTDTLHDERILVYLSQILLGNPDIEVEIGGHTALNEDTLLGLKRAHIVIDKLSELNVTRSRLTAANYAHREPIISDDILFSLPNREERNAANQKNRRVSVRVIHVTEEDEEPE